MVFLSHCRLVNSVPSQQSSAQWQPWHQLGLWVPTLFLIEVTATILSATKHRLISLHQCSIICDWIMLTFIDKNEVYSERKFDEVSKMNTLLLWFTHTVFEVHWPRTPVYINLIYPIQKLHLHLRLSFAGQSGAHRVHSPRVLLHQQLRIKPLRSVRWCTAVILLHMDGLWSISWLVSVMEWPLGFFCNCRWTQNWINPV